MLQYLSSTMFQVVSYLLISVSLYGSVMLCHQVYTWYTSPLRKVPGPPVTSFLLGYMLVILREPFMDPHKRWWNDYRKKQDGASPPFLAYSIVFGSYSLCVLDPDIVKLVLMEPASRDPVRFVKNISSSRNYLV
jgi:hypothetical protein